MGLLERDGQLAVLVDRLGQAGEAGRLVLIAGEAGAGKTALVDEFRARHLDPAGTRVLVGRCDDLFAARPLGPFADIARDHPGALSAALAAGDPAAAFEAFLTDVATPPHPVVVVLEDLQWADEATLDLLRFVARRLDVLPCLVIVTHRDDLAPDHPLRRAWGSLVGPAVTRLSLAPLSERAVGEMASGTGIDAASLFARTRGNPFFVTEVIAAEHEQLPATVRDTILARVGHLSGAARDVLETAAVLGRQSDLHLLTTVADADIAPVEECLAAGLFVLDDRGLVGFRHDLTREAIDQSLTPLRRRQLHRRVLDALPDDLDDVVRRAHHAVGSGDGDAIVTWATQAADRCVVLGAHRQAESLYRKVIEHHERLPLDERIRLLQQHARMCVHVEDMDAAVASGDAALTLLEECGEPRALGGWETELSTVYYNAARVTESAAVVGRALERLEPLGPSEELVRARAAAGGVHLVGGRFDRARDAARSAIELGERLGDERSVAYAMNTLGAALTCLGDPEAGMAPLREAVDRAKRGDFVSEYCVASSNLGTCLTAAGRLGDGVDVLSEAMRVAEEHELIFRRNCLAVTRFVPYALLGRWDDALADVATLLGDPTLSEHHRMFALEMRARVEVRRGDPAAAATLAEALALATSSGEVQIEHPVRLLLAELAWMAGDTEAARAQVEAVAAVADAVDVATARDLVTWCVRLGVDGRPAVDLPPIPAIVAGDVRAVARFWDEVGSPFNAADALGDSDDEADLREAYDRLLALGARPRAAMVARQLRSLGARDLPRGPRASTRANAAGLTAREVEVAQLLRDGRTNAEIAAELILSPKTVDHHVSAVLSKLGVNRRAQVKMMWPPAATS